MDLALILSAAGIAAAIYIPLRIWRGQQTAALADRDHRARSDAALVDAAAESAAGNGWLAADARLVLTSHAAALRDVEIYAHAFIPGGHTTRLSRRAVLPPGAPWSAPGTGAPVPQRSAWWTVWWTCPAGYRWRLAVRARRAGRPRCLARPPGSAPPAASGVRHRVRAALWPYTYAAPIGAGDGWDLEVPSAYAPGAPRTTRAVGEHRDHTTPPRWCAHQPDRRARRGATLASSCASRYRAREGVSR